MAFALAKACTKVGVAGGAIYWSAQQGVWGSPEEGAEAMRRFKAIILPDDESAPKITKVQAPQLQHEGVVLSSWNHGAKTAFECLRDVPEHTQKAKETLTNFVQESFKS